MPVRCLQAKKPADNLLTWILICLFTHLSIKFFIYAASGNTLLKTGFNTFIDLGYGPLLWMYARRVQYDQYRPVQHWYLLLPMFAAAVMYTAIAVKLMIDPAGVVNWLLVYNEVSQYLIVACMTVFPLLSLQVSRQLPTFWKSEKQLIKKIAFCFLLIPVIWIVTNIINALQIADGPSLNIAIRIIAYSNMLVICLFIIQYRLEVRSLLNSTAAPEQLPASLTHFPMPAVLIEEKESLILTIQAAALPTEEQDQPAQRRSTLTTLQQQAIAVKLLTMMEEKKTYTDPELTLEKLSSLLKTPRHHLSEVLNQHLHQTFYQYVNDYRIREVLHLLDRCRQQQVTPIYFHWPMMQASIPSHPLISTLKDHRTYAYRIPEAAGESRNRK
ncbi:hypothetical protein [Paraflavitalea speifideaquila]|uniref:helix-turn-helix domain-containing protein n=1 Tax=Paraflavitalea speifideaquila TaxID=3076558 RepID=UPI0028E4E4CC|nr:hypothetical protein [Paraflavitalea speifideiaquila]